MAKVDDLRRITYAVLIGFVLMLVAWISFVTLSGCRAGSNCLAAVPAPARTSIPTLHPATQPAPVRALGAAAPLPVDTTAGAAERQPASTDSVPRPSNPGGPGEALNLTGDAAAGEEVYIANCQACHNVEGIGGNPNPGSADGVVPPLNPIDPQMKSADLQEFATNIDLFMEHGSTPAGPNPALVMLAWGDDTLLTPQQIADVIAYVIKLNP
jgi:mono/diheme cytochrome c family protein